MPRAYYKPFTAYEELVGFQNAKRNAFICCGLFFGGIVFKCVLMLNYSPVSSYGSAQAQMEALEQDPQYRARMEARVHTSEMLMDKDAARRSVRAKLGAPPA